MDTFADGQARRKVGPQALYFQSKLVRERSRALGDGAAQFFSKHTGKRHRRASGRTKICGQRNRLNFRQPWYVAHHDQPAVRF